ncbi:multicopper oxidase-domain-containing protein [Aspergillus avenaceus]|uniref:Multicopper oxidase-domain-containing protein n=1 Tax=Aspergillus avenaceus TaxID=36643 RepID=A0A5N6TKQ3_ASPAV|nr:multicopper oxidase-domain-containing protein [Aspergillus avenaceus]
MARFPGGLSLLALLYFAQWASCKLVQFNLDLTWEDHEVAGSTRKMILSNGQFPAPQLRLKQGDEVEFLVNNSLPFGTTVHFHGIEQRGTPWSDGVPGLSQKPIAPGDHFLYKWQANEYGAYLYHAHTRGQVDDGLYGAIYIEPSDAVEKPFHLLTDDEAELDAILQAEKDTQPIILADWRRLTSEEVWNAQVASGLEDFCTNSILINGKGSEICLSQDRIDALTSPALKQVLGNTSLTDMACLPSDPEALKLTPPGFRRGCTPHTGPTEILEVDPSTQYRSWDVSSMASTSSLAFSIDKHPVYIYAIDGRYIEPLRVDALTIAIGTRYSILVKLDQAPTDYPVRAANNVPAQIINGTAILRYKTPAATATPPPPPPTTTPYITELGTNATASTTFLNESAVTPFPPISPALTSHKTFILNVDHAGASYRWTLGNASFPLSNEDATPLLFNRTSIPAKYLITTQNNTWVDIIINMTSSGQPPHPIHKHSNKYFVIGAGQGSFTYASVAEAVKHVPQNFNFVTPQIRDTFPTPSAAAGPAWLAIRYQVVNPGPFLLHCHLQLHLSGGMALALLDGVDAWPVVPGEYRMPAVSSS